MLFYILAIIFFKQFIDYVFDEKISHSLFRTFFCFFISTISSGFSILNWENLIANPLEQILISTFINKLMFSYMLVDTIYLLFDAMKKKDFRLELLFHHFICICLYGLHYDKSILAFCALGEILSAFNWIGILYPQYEWTVKLFRLYSILCIRLFVWIFTLFFLHKCHFLLWFGFVGIMIFLSLDCYWAWIIISNYLKYKSFIKQKIIFNTNKKIIPLKKKYLGKK